jgi:hypothetical protein
MSAVASLRNLIPHEIRIPVFILIVAALVTVVDLVFNAQFHELYLVLGIFIPLIVTNCIVLARVEAFANKNPPLQSLLDGVFMGVGMLWTLALLGGLRELIGGGTLFSGIDMVFPGAAAAAVAAGRLPRLPARHTAARCLHPAWLPDRLEELGRSARSCAQDRLGSIRRRAGAHRPCLRRGAGVAEDEQQQRHELFVRLRAANPDPLTELDLRDDLPVADRRHPVGAGHRQERQPRHQPALCRRADAAGDAGARRERPGRVHQPHRPLSGQGPEHHRHLSAVARPACGEVPCSRVALEALPGVGRKTANVVLNTAFGEPTIAVDTHIFRVANRTGLAVGRTPLAVERELLAGGARGVQAFGPSLADPARALRLQGAQARVLALRHRRPLRLSREEC